jgi:hypothetical protein
LAGDCLWWCVAVGGNGAVEADGVRRPHIVLDPPVRAPSLNLPRQLQRVVRLRDLFVTHNWSSLIASPMMPLVAASQHTLSMRRFDDFPASRTP